MKKILNVGCGNDTYGTDFVDLYPQRKEVKKCIIDREKLPYKDNIFDEVRFYFAFEHLRNHDFVLKEIKRVLKAGGKLDLKTDNASYWYYALDNKTHTGRYENKQMYGETDRHFGLFTDNHLKNYIEDTGFKDHYISYFENSGNPTSAKGKTVILINKIVSSIKPIRRMGFGGIQIVAVK